MLRPLWRGPTSRWSASPRQAERTLDPALAAIRAGKHVIIEKPLEITTERVDCILDAAEKAGVRVAAVFQARFGAGARTVKAGLDAGRFGRLVLCSAQVKWHRSATYYTGWKGTLALDGGGAVINQAIHGLDLLQWVRRPACRGLCVDHPPGAYRHRG